MEAPPDGWPRAAADVPVINLLITAETGAGGAGAGDYWHQCKGRVNLAVWGAAGEDHHHCCRGRRHWHLGVGGWLACCYLSAHSSVGHCKLSSSVGHYKLVI
jgi:hypothetical protein